MSEPKPTIMRSLGRFFGEIGRAVRSSPGGSTAEVRRTVETEERETPRGTVTLRRTTIEEVEIDPREQDDRPTDADERRS